MSHLFAKHHLLLEQDHTVILYQRKENTIVFIIIYT
jgi:hypothetical protein